MYLRYRPLGRNKIQDAWGATVYQVVDILGTTYTVQPVEEGPSRRVNRMDIRSCVSPPIETSRDGTVPPCEPELVLNKETETEEDPEKGGIVEEVSYCLKSNPNTEGSAARDYGDEPVGVEPKVSPEG